MGQIFIQLAFEMEEQFSFFIASVAIKKSIKTPSQIASRSLLMKQDSVRK